MMALALKAPTARRICAFNLPRMASDTGFQLICDPGENYKMSPEMSRIFYSRRALVVLLLKLLVTLNKW